MLWTDDSFKKFVGDIPEYRKFQDRVDNFKKGIILGDFIRLLVLYHFGGVYVDCDVECLESIDNWSFDETRLNVAREPKEHETLHSTKNIICNALFICPPKQQVLMKILVEGNKINDSAPLEVLKSYGPLAWTKHVKIDEVNMLPVEDYYPIPDLTNTMIKYSTPSKKEYLETTSNRSWNTNTVHYWDHSNIKRESILDIFSEQTNAIRR